VRPNLGSIFASQPSPVDVKPTIIFSPRWFSIFSQIQVSILFHFLLSKWRPMAIALGKSSLYSISPRSAIFFFCINFRISEAISGFISALVDQAGAGQLEHIQKLPKPLEIAEPGVCGFRSPRSRNPLPAKDDITGHPIPGDPSHQHEVFTFFLTLLFGNAFHLCHQFTGVFRAYIQASMHERETQPALRLIIISYILLRNRYRLFRADVIAICATFAIQRLHAIFAFVKRYCIKATLLSTKPASGALIGIDLQL